MSDGHVSVYQLITNLLKIAAQPVRTHPEPFFRELRPLEDEKSHAHRSRVREILGLRWGYAPNTVRAFEGYGNGTAERFPTLRSDPKFFADMAKYGRAEFDKGGKLKRESIGRGPTDVEFLRSVPRRARSVA